MKRETNQLTPAQVDRLMDRLRADAAGEHPSDEEFVAYLMREVSMEERSRFATHVSGCEECATRLEFLQAGAEMWRGNKGKARLAALRQRILPPKQLLPILREQLAGLVLSQRISLAAARVETYVVEQGQAADGVLHWFVEEDEQTRDLVVRLSSAFLPAGTKVHLRAGKWTYDVTLVQVTAGEVGAEIVIPASDREKLEPATGLQVEEVIEAL